MKYLIGAFFAVSLIANYFLGKRIFLYKEYNVHIMVVDQKSDIYKEGGIITFNSLDKPRYKTNTDPKEISRLVNSESVFVNAQDYTLIWK